ncbi:MAG: polysaccharide biosynthesis protein PslG [Verrucomicrobiota bacterium]
MIPPSLIYAVAEAPYPDSKIVVMRLLAILSVAIGCVTAHAGDDRFGFATHFEQGWPSNPVMQAIASTGVSYIRDDLNAWSWEPSRGVYVHPSWDMGWLNAAKANGLKVVAILGPNSHYTDKYDPVAMSNLAAWIAKTGLVTAFEVTNEPNNDYASHEGSTWKTKLVALTNAVTAAVHAVNPSIQVIGLGAQGTQIFDMLAMGTTMSGVVYHPYGNEAGYIPESTYEWEWRDYGSWIQVLDSKTRLPKWETEWGTGTTTTFTNTNQAEFIARRLLQASGLGVEHSFIYEFEDNGPEHYGVDSSNPTTPKIAFYVVQRIISTLAGVHGGTSFVTVNSVANGDVADVKAFAYQGSINKTVVAFWFGNYDPRTPPAASTCQLTFTVPHPYTQPYVMNAVTGAQVPLSSYNWSQSGIQCSVAGLPISDQPLIIVMQ